MYTAEEVVLQMFKQTAKGQAPASPDGIVVPSEISFNPKHGRNKVENPQRKTDGNKREFAHGNHTASASGTIVGNLNFLGHLLLALCGSLTTAAFSGIYKVAVTAGGSGYTSAPTVVFTGGTGGTGVAGVSQVRDGAVVAVYLTNRGSGYAGVPTVSFTGGGGTGAAATASSVTGYYKHEAKLATGAPVFWLFEKGPKGSTFWRRYYDMVQTKFGANCTVEGIAAFTTEWLGSGKFEKKTASLDATPTEVTGAPGEYANMALLVNDVVNADILELNYDVTQTVKEKRTHNSGGIATDMRKGGFEVVGSMKAYFESETLADMIDSSTLLKILSTLETADAMLDTLLPEVKGEITDWETTEEGLMIPIPFESIKKASADAPAKWTLINQVASY